MRYRVRVLVDAEDDLFEIYNYVAAQDTPERAEALLANLERACSSLSALPNRGRIPPELKPLGISDYREIFFKPYRIIYRVDKRTVFVYAIFDGRRDLSEILYQRLIR